MKETSTKNDKVPSQKVTASTVDVLALQFEPLALTNHGQLARKPLTSNNVLYLQRLVGNQAVNRLLPQTNLRQTSSEKQHLPSPSSQIGTANTTAFSSLNSLAQHHLSSEHQGNKSWQIASRSAQLVQRKNNQDMQNVHVGAVEDGVSLRDNEGGTGNTPGKWHNPNEGGFSRLMQGAAGEMTQDMVSSGKLDNLMLRHVVADISGLEQRKKKWAWKATQANNEISSWSPPSINKFYEKKAASANNQVAVIEKCGAELQQKANQFNSFVPQGNGFYISAARLASMQSMLGAVDNASLVDALVYGLQDAEDVMKRYRDKYEDGNRKLTTEKLDTPESDESVSTAASEMTNASRELDAAYMSFQTTVLAGNIGTVKQEYAKDESRLKEINQVKQTVRNIGKTIDFTMTVVRGAPTMATNVTAKVTKAKAGLNAVRNRRDIIAGKRPRFNPTYLTTDASGNMVVRNMQTNIDRNVITNEKLPAPVDDGISLPSDVSGLLGKIADFAYSSEVKKINMRLEQMKSRIGAIKAVINATETERKILAYQNALNKFATKAAKLQERIEARRKEYREFGTQLDRFAQVDRETRNAAQGTAKGAERYTTIMTMVAGVQETLALGEKSQAAAPPDLRAWWATVKRRRFGLPTDGELSSATNIQGQLRFFRKNVNKAKKVFGPVAAQAQKLMGKY